MNIDNNEKWKAVISCNKDYDGMFFYGVKTTGIFCRPSCKSKTPIRDNVIFFDNISKAIERGFRPCKRCCPDKLVFEPELEIIEKAKAMIDTGYNNKADLNYISKQLGVSKNYLIKLFKKNVGITVSQYITKVRVNNAETLLNKNNMSIIEIAYEVGFKSLSNFYRCFKQQTGYTPNEHRKK